MSVEGAELSVRTSRVLMEAGYTTLADVAAASDKDLLALDGFGAKSLSEIREYLDDAKRGCYDHAADAAELVGLPRSMSDADVVRWLNEHKTLLLALIRGEAVIVPKAK